jgi:hypothetical protein
MNIGISKKQIFEDNELIDEIIHKTKNIAIEIHDAIVSRDNIENKLKKHFKQFYRLGELTIASNNE